MKRNLLAAILAVALVLLAEPVHTTVAGVAKRTGKNAAVLRSAADVFPGTAYDNAYQIPGARGKVNMIQPKGNVDVILAVSADGLTPDSLYTVSFDTNGIVPDNILTAGPWVLVGEFRTNERGHGEWNYTAPAGTFPPGKHTYSVFINRTAPKATVLISDNVEFEIAAK